MLLIHPLPVRWKLSFRALLVDNFQLPSPVTQLLCCLVLPGGCPHSLLLLLPAAGCAIQAEAAAHLEVELLQEPQLLQCAEHLAQTLELIVGHVKVCQELELEQAAFQCAQPVVVCIQLPDADVVVQVVQTAELVVVQPQHLKVDKALKSCQLLKPPTTQAELRAVYECRKGAKRSTTQIKVSTQHGQQQSLCRQASWGGNTLNWTVAVALWGCSVEQNQLLLHITLS